MHLSGQRVAICSQETQGSLADEVVEQALILDIVEANSAEVAFKEVQNIVMR